MWLFGERAATTRTRTSQHLPCSATSSELMETLQLQDPAHSWLVSPVLWAWGLSLVPDSLLSSHASLGRMESEGLESWLTRGWQERGLGRS